MNARQTTLLVLNSVDSTDKTLDRIMEEADGRVGPSSFAKESAKRERAFLNALVYGVLRWRGRIDTIISHFSKIPLKKIEPGVLNALRMGVFQVERMDSVPVHAAVDTSVGLVKTLSGRRAAGFANGILRNVSRNMDRVRFPDAGKDPAPAFAARKSFPEWLVKRWLDRFGTEETGRLCDAINEIPPVTVRANSLTTGRSDLIGAPGFETIGAKKTLFSPVGIEIKGRSSSIFKSEAFKNGCFQVQDEAAQLVSYMLGPKPGHSVLDACAGLGGKTGHIAELMKNRGAILAIDSNREKLAKLAREMKRLKVSTVKAMRFDILKENGNNPGMFDKVLVDAPCSGLGVLRRNPDAKWKMAEEKLEMRAKLQSVFLDNVADRVKPSGSLVYAACSMEPEENEKIAEKFLTDHPQFIVDKKLPGLPEKARRLVNSAGFLKTYPHLHKMDGFFVVCFKKLEI